MNKFVCGLALQILLFCNPSAQSAQPTPRASAPDPAQTAPALLATARDAMGFSHIANRVLYSKAVTLSEQNYQSDRTYPPFFAAVNDEEIWFDPGNGVLRVQSQGMFPGSGPLPVSTNIDDGTNVQLTRGERTTAISRRQAGGRYLNAFAVIRDWSAAHDVRVAGSERYRDYPRIVLTRNTSQGEQRLYVDPKTGFPVKLDFFEPHYLWGQRHIEYVWSNWTMTGGVVLPGSAFRIADGDVELSQTVGATELIPPSAAPSLTPPQAPAKPPADLPMFLQPLPPQAIPVSESLYLLSNPGYNEVIARANDEIYIFDATQGEERAKQDAAEIRKLFPGAHKLNVVVTDLAWPHIAGVRYWVSQGATIIAHAAARDFLLRVIDRRWTLSPDSLERKRRRDGDGVKLSFLPVDRELSLAGGAVKVAPIDGIGSEVALVAFVLKERFLWASDYIQSLDKPSLYAGEVVQAAKRTGFAPDVVAAEHLPVTDWKVVQSMQLGSAVAGPQ